jgi:hypothetical protein
MLLRLPFRLRSGSYPKSIGGPARSPRGSIFGHSSRIACFSAAAIETSHGSVPDPPAEETHPPELSADAASATAIETSHASTQGPSTVETAPSELSVPQEVSAPPASTADTASAAQHAAGLTIPTLATSSRGSPPLRHATSHRQDAAEADHKITKKLNLGT